MPFTWWHVTEHGTAEPVADSPEVCARIDAGEPGWFGSIEGAILHGGVQATAFELKQEQLFETAAYFDRREWVPAGTRCTITITAKPRAS